MLRDCVLVDEQYPNINVMSISKDLETKPEIIANTRQKREIKKGYFTLYEKVKFIALEGTSLTMLGLIKYNKKTDNFEMTELSMVLSGGLKEVQKYLSEKIDHLNWNKTRLKIVGAAALGLSLYLLYLWCRKRYLGEGPGDEDEDLKPKKHL